MGHSSARLAVPLIAVLLAGTACTASAGRAPASGTQVQRSPQRGSGIAEDRRGARQVPAARSFPAAENARPGTRAWRITPSSRLGAPGAIEGYADHVSVLPGQSFRLYVSTTSAVFRVQAYRIGWYHGSDLARLVWKSGQVAGRVQAPARVIPGVHMVTAPWHPSLIVATPDWPPGAYLLKLIASGGAQRYVPITVRSPSTAGKVVLINDVTTWQAYNTWGGYDLYTGPGGFAGRSRAVTFDRPYADSGAGWFLAFDQAAIALAERAGVPLAYETDADIQQNPGILSGARAVISLGHDEYYSAAMRQALLRARNAGTNLAFLGANAMYRHIRFASSALGPDRVVICYKVAAEDPLYGKDNAVTTQDWRDPPDPRPESVITGVLYECNPVSAPYVVYDPKNWIFAGTVVRKGTSFPGLVGPEYDRVIRDVPFPRPLEILAHSPVTCAGAASYADSAYYTVPSGAGVFAAGTMRWVCALRGPYCGHGVTWAADHFVRRATENLLRVFAAGPAGRSHPAASDLAQVRPAGPLSAAPGD